MRKDARECVYKLLFSNLFNDYFDDEFKRFIYADSKLDGKDVEFADELLSVILKHSEEIDGVIAEYAKGYNIDRIYSTDKCALVIAICEMKYFDDIPLIVSINEAMELVRKYSTEQSLNFVNGILAQYKIKLEEQV